jgi:hypothetical protein
VSKQRIGWNLKSVKFLGEACKRLGNISNESWTLKEDSDFRDSDSSAELAPFRRKR